VKPNQNIGIFAWKFKKWSFQAQYHDYSLFLEHVHIIINTNKARQVSLTHHPSQNRDKEKELSTRSNSQDGTLRRVYNCTELLYSKWASQVRNCKCPTLHLTREERKRERNEINKGSSTKTRKISMKQCIIWTFCTPLNTS
jgi:hypothetical protein